MQEDPWDVLQERAAHAAKVKAEQERVADKNAAVKDAVIKIFEEKRNASGIRKLEMRDLKDLGAGQRNYDHGQFLKGTQHSNFVDTMASDGITSLTHPVEDILAERQHTHGDFTLQSAFAQQLKDSLRHAAGYGRLSNGAREALEMICVKISRIVCGDCNHKDSWDDIAGYATLVSKTLK